MFSGHRFVGTKLAALPLDPRVCQEGSTCSGNFLKPAVFNLNGVDARKTMRRNRSSKKRIDTTLGDLIEALSEVAFEQCKDAKEAYTLAGLVLADVLSNCLRSDLTPIQSGRRDKKSSLYNDKYFNRRHWAFVR